MIHNTDYMDEIDEVDLLEQALEEARERIAELESELENLRYDHRKLEEHDEKVTAALMDGTEGELDSDGFPL